MKAEDAAKLPPEERPAWYRPASGAPASGVSGEPARPPTGSLPEGHLLRLKHGAFAPRVYGPVAEGLAAELLEDSPELRAFPDAVGAWASAESRVLLLRRHLEEVGSIDPETHEPRAGLLDLLAKHETVAAKQRAVMGLDPPAAASLARERASAAVLVSDLHSLADRGRQILTAREVDPVAAVQDAARAERDRLRRELTEASGEVGHGET